MIRWISPALAGMALACLSWTGALADERRPARIDDILSMSSFGAVSLSPDGRHAAWVRQGPYDEGPRFDRDWRSAWSAGVLMIADLEEGAAPLPVDEGAAGLLQGPWSPDGARLMVYRLVGEIAEAGIADVRTGRVRWTGLAPDLPLNGAGAAWLGADRFLLSVRTDGRSPWQLRFQTPGAEVMAERWRISREGKVPSRQILDTREAAVAAEEPWEVQTLMMASADDGKAVPLLTGSIRDFELSPGGAWAAILVQAEATPSPVEERNVQSAVLRRGRLRLVETATGRVVEPEEEMDVAPHLLRWSPDGREIAIWRRREDATWREGGLVAIATDGTIRRIDVNGLEPREKGRTLDELRAVRVDWIGDRLLFYAREPDGDRFDWWRLDPDGPVAMTRKLSVVPDRLTAVNANSARLVADGRLWRLARTGEAEPLAEVGPELRSAEPVNLLDTVRSRSNSAARRGWSPLFEAGGLAAYGNDGRRIWRSSRACDGELRVRAVAGARALAVCDLQGVSVLTAEEASGSRVLERLNPDFGDLQLPRPMPVPHRDRLGRPVVSYLYRPPGLAASEIRGVIVDFYPGRGDAGRWTDALSLRSGMLATVLAMGKYAVLSPTSAAEGESDRAEMLDDFRAGLDLAIDAAEAAAPDLPWSRLALYGHSFGGYGALGVAARTDRFRTYVVSSAPTQMFGKWGEPMPVARLWPNPGSAWIQSAGATEQGQAKLEVPPWEAPDVYARASPMLGAPCIRAPVLLITADRDYVPATQSEAMFAALHRLGKRARLITYWGEGHGMTSPANFRDLHAQIFRWLDETLGEAESSSLQPFVPGADPAFEQGGEKDVGIVAAANEGVACQSRFGALAVDDAEGGQAPVQEPGSQVVETVGDHPAEEGGELAL